MYVEAEKPERVVFRKWKDDGQIVALFPDIQADDDGHIVSYVHVGQHGAANYQHCIGKSVPATIAEAAPLKKELEDMVGYVLAVIQRRNRRRTAANSLTPQPHGLSLVQRPEPERKQHD